MLVSGVYLLLKCGMLVERATVLMASARAILRQEAAYGQYAKPEEVMESGNQCAICQVSSCITVIAVILVPAIQVMTVSHLSIIDPCML